MNPFSKHAVIFVFRLIITKLGHHFVVLTALSLYSLRLVGFSLLPSLPSASSAGAAALALETLKPACTTLLLISCMTFVRDASPMETAATAEGVFGSAYFGVGRGLGAVAGAAAWEAVGVARTFQV